jgi:hypothetical protein
MSERSKLVVISGHIGFLETGSCVRSEHNVTAKRDRTESCSRYFALVPKIVIPRLSTRFHKQAGSLSGLPS